MRTLLIFLLVLSTSSALFGSQIAVYRDKGVWKPALAELKQFLKKHRYSYRFLTAKQIKEGNLKQRHYSLLIVPGGNSVHYVESLGTAGAKRILRFVERGGSYLGICAGAYYATSGLHGRAIGPWGIGLLMGTAVDGTYLKTPGFRYGMVNFDLVKRGRRIGNQQISLLLGPGLLISPLERSLKHVRTIAKFPNSPYDAIVKFRYQRGRVVLSSPHLEIEEGNGWGDKNLKDPDSEWPLLNKLIKWLLHR